MLTTETPSQTAAFVENTEDRLKGLLVESGAILKGHFVLASGRHSDVYIEKFRVLERPQYHEPVCKAIAEHFRSLKPDVIVGPSTGGMIVAYEVARQMGVPAVYVELEGDKRVLKRNGKIAAGARALLVDDVLTTGKSLMGVLEVIADSQAELIGVGVLIDRSETAIDFGAKLFAACRFELKTYPADNLPAWLEEIPIAIPGTLAKASR